jgi:hypothetical protein
MAILNNLVIALFWSYPVCVETWRLGVMGYEDATRLTLGQAGHNMAILNNLVIGLCLPQGLHTLAQARRRFSARPQEALQLILFAP